MLRYWDEFGKQFRDLDNFNSLGHAMGVVTRLGDHLKVLTNINYNNLSSVSLLTYQSQFGKGKLGLQTTNNNKTNTCINWTLPFQTTDKGRLSIESAGSIALFKSHSQQYGVTWKQQFKYVAMNLKVETDTKLDKPQYGYSTVVGKGPFAIGGKISGIFDDSFTKTDADWGAEYKQSSCGIHVRTKKWLNIIQGSVCNHVNDTLLLGISHSFDKKTGQTKSGIVAQIFDYQFPNDLNAKFKLDTNGDVAACLQMRLDFIKGHINLGGNLRSNEAQVTGIGLSIGDV